MIYCLSKNHIVCKNSYIFYHFLINHNQDPINLIYGASVLEQVAKELYILLPI